MTNEELTKYLEMMNREYGQRGWQDTDPVSPLAGEEGWSDIIRDQLRTNQFGDQSLNQSFAEKDLPRGLGLLSSREDAEQVLRSRLVDNPDYPHIKMTPTPKSMMSTDGVPRGPQLGEPNLGFASVSQPEEIFPPNPWDSGPAASSAFHAAEGELPLGKSPFDLSVSAPEELWDRSTLRRLGMETGPSATDKAIATAYPLDYPAGGAVTSVEGAQAVSSAEAGLGAIEAAEAAELAESGWGGPATFAASQALNLIPTRDREKKSTPFGDEGSMSGILKGTGKGALFGATIGSAFPVVGTTVGAVGGGVLGALGGAQGYFDSTSAPMISMSRIRRGGGGMQGGLLGGGSFYG